MKRMIYATVAVGDGAQGSQSLFISPVGQPMPMLVGPSAKCPTCHRYDGIVATLEHTNIQMTGHFGTAIGDVELTSLQALTSDGSRLLAHYTVYVGGGQVLGGPLYEIEKPKELPRIHVERDDLFDVRLTLDHVIKRTPEQGMLFVKFEFWAEVLA